MEGQDIRLAMEYIQLSAQVLAQSSITDENVKKAAGELCTKSFNILNDSLKRASANMAGIITG